MRDSDIPAGLEPHFQEYDVRELQVGRDASLIMQRTLEHGGWADLRWLIDTYGAKRLREFVRDHGERMLSPVTFTYWRKLLRLRRWRKAPFPAARREVWDR